MHKLVVVVGVLLASSATAWAQGDKKPQAAVTSPTQLPGEEKLSAQERAERDFLMPVRRKHAATLRAAAEEAAVNQPAVEVTARNLEAAPKEEERVTEPVEAKSAPVVVHRTSSTHRRSSSAHRRSTSSARKKTTARKHTTKKKTTSRRRR